MAHHPDVTHRRAGNTSVMAERVADYRPSVWQMTRRDAYERARDTRDSSSYHLSRRGHRPFRPVRSEHRINTPRAMLRKLCYVNELVMQRGIAAESPQHAKYVLGGPVLCFGLLIKFVPFIPVARYIDHQLQVDNVCNVANGNRPTWGQLNSSLIDELDIEGAAGLAASLFLP